MSATNSTSNPFIFPDAAVHISLVAGSILCVLGVTGNALTMVLILHTRRLWNPVSAFIFNMSSIDLTLTGIFYPIMISVHVQGWHGNVALCEAFAFVIFLSLGASLWALVLVTFNRYVLVAHSEKYHSIYRARYIVLMVVLSWFITGLILLFPALKIGGGFGYEERIRACTLIRSESSRINVAIYGIGIGTPALSIIICYYKIFKVVQTSRNKILVHEKSKSTERRRKKRGKYDMKLVKMSLVIFGTFTCCLLPYILMNLLDRNVEYPTTHIAVTIVAWSNSSANPIIYVLLNQQFREAYKAMLPCFDKTKIFSIRNERLTGSIENRTMVVATIS